jgi:protein tyrosine phosphatase
MEYKILTRINCHKKKYDCLFKSYHSDFRERNRYPEILPFKHSMVMTSNPKGPIIFGLRTIENCSNLSEHSLGEEFSNGHFQNTAPKLNN